jgi:hypothetical protein
MHTMSNRQNYIKPWFTSDCSLYLSCAYLHTRVDIVPISIDRLLIDNHSTHPLQAYRHSFILYPNAPSHSYTA